MEREPRIVVNGVVLSEGQAMSVRVAIEMFMRELDGGLADDIGQSGQNYRARLGEVRSAMSLPVRVGHGVPHDHIRIGGCYQCVPGLSSRPSRSGA